MVKHIAEHDHLPDYRVAFDEETDLVMFHNRDRWWVNAPLPSDGETLPPLPVGGLRGRPRRRARL